MGVAICVGVGMGFCKVPIDEQDLACQDKIVQMVMQKPCRAKHWLCQLLAMIRILKFYPKLVLIENFWKNFIWRI